MMKVNRLGEHDYFSDKTDIRLKILHSEFL